MYQKIEFEKAWLVQSIYQVRNEQNCLIKALFVGVKESVKAVRARFLQNGFISFENGDYLRTTPYTASKLCMKNLSGTPYVIGGIYHPSLLNELVCGQSLQELHEQSLRLFKKLNLPIIKQWMPTFWDIAVQESYATKLETFGVDCMVWQLNIPEQSIFIPHIEQRLDELYKLAKAA